MEPISGIIKSLHSCIHIKCRNSNCDKVFSIQEINQHIKSCKTMGSYNHSDHPLREARSNVVEDRVGDIFNKIDEMCNEKGDNTTDV